jgi:hypothetical protein
MTKNEIIEKTLKEMAVISLQSEPPYSDGHDEEEFIVALLRDVLPEGDIRTCEDFRHLNVLCCETCHQLYPHYDMSLIHLPDGGKAWLCDAVRRAISPERHQLLKRLNTNHTGGFTDGYHQQQG